MNRQPEIVNKLRQLKPVLDQRFSVERIGYFGSFSRNEETVHSDIDILVSFKKPIGWAFFDLQDFLEEELKLKVDLVTENALKEQLRDGILNSVRYI